MPNTYESRIDLRLPLKAPVSDPELFPAVQNLHNALHTLNAAFNQTVDVISAPKDETKNSASFSFRLQSFWGTIAPGQTFEIGKPATLQSDGFHMGAFGVSLGAGNPTMTLPYGFVLDIDTENSLALLGWPPAIIETSGIVIGDVLYARENDGAFLIKNMADGLPGGSDGVDGNKFHPIGYCIFPDQTLLSLSLIRTNIFKL